MEKFAIVLIVGMLTVTGVGAYFASMADRQREHEAHLERMELLKQGKLIDGGTR